MSRVHTRTVLDWDGRILEDDWYEYDGPWALLKETQEEKQARINLQNMQTTAAQNYYTTDLPAQRQQAAAELKAYQDAQAQQLEMQRQAQALQTSQYNDYSQMMKTALQRQYGIQDQVTGAMSPYLSGKVGFSPDEMTAMNNQNMTGTAASYQDANAMLKQKLLAMGMNGQQMPGGPEVRGTAELSSGLANTTSTNRNNLLLANARQAMTNQFNAAGVMGGVAGQQGSTVGIGASGSNAAASGFGTDAYNFANITRPITSAPGVPAMLAPPKPTGFWSGFGNKLLGMGTLAGATALTGGVNNVMSGDSFFGR